MSLKFWLYVMIVSMALAHTYVYTDLIWHTEPEIAGEVPRFFRAVWFILSDGCQQLKAELKQHLEVAQKAAEQVHKNIAQFRERREQLRAKRKLQT